MKFLLLLCLSTTVLALAPVSPTKSSQSFEFIKSVSFKAEDGERKPRASTSGSSARVLSSGSNSAEKLAAKNRKSTGVPSYAVSMEPLVKYSQPDPLYEAGKTTAAKAKVLNVKKSDHHVRVKKEDGNAGGLPYSSPSVHGKAGYSYSYDNGGLEGTQYQHLGFAGHGHYYDHHYQEPEPIIEIIIKESNQSLPAPPPPPPPPKKKKKEPVQVFYVKYKKEPSSHYGGEKIVYEPPIPAITPPSNDHHEEEEDEHEEYHHHHEEPVTLPPRPSTTLKAIIRPDSETYHGSGIRITFGGPKDDEAEHHHHHNAEHDHHASGGYEEQSAPQPSVLLPPNAKASVPIKPTLDSQLTKRNPSPFQSPTQPPQQSFQGGSSFSGPPDYYRPTAVPLYQNTARFSAQPHPFTPQSPKIPPSLPPPSPSPTPSRSPSSLRFTSVPHFPSFSTPQQNFAFPQPSQPTLQQSATHSQQLFSINQPHLKSSFSISSRSAVGQPYQTISNRVTQLPFPKIPPGPPGPPGPSFQGPPKPLPQPTRAFPKPGLPFPQQQPSPFSPSSHSHSQQPFSHSQNVDIRGQNPAALPLQPSPQLSHHLQQHQALQQQQQHQQQYQLDQFKQQQHHQQIEQFNHQQRHQQLEQQRQQHLEQQRQQRLEQQRLQELEKQHQQQLEQQRLQQLEKQHQQQLEQQRLQQLEKQHQQHLEHQRQQRLEQERQQQLEEQRRQQLEQQRNQQLEQQRLHQLEQLKQQRQQQQHREQIERLNQLQRQQQQHQQQQAEQLQRQQQLEQLRQQHAEHFQRQQHQQQQLNQIHGTQEIHTTQTYQNQNSANHQPSKQSTYAPEIIRSISAEIPFDSNHRFEGKLSLESTSKSQQFIQQDLPSTTRGHFILNNVEPTSRPQFVQNTLESSRQQQFGQNTLEPSRQQQFVQNVQQTSSRPNFIHNVQPNTQRYTVSKNSITTTQSYKKYTETTQPSVEYITHDPKRAEEERRKKEERRKQNVAALPDEVPEDLRKQLLSSDILSNADIQILDYDKIGDIPIDKLPPEALANFQAVAGSEPVPAVAKPESSSDEIVAEGSEQRGVAVPPPSDAMEMKVVRYNPDSKEGAQLANQYMKEGATQLEPVVLNDSRYNRYLPLKVSGAQFPVPDVPELRGKNVTSVVVLAPVDYEFLQRHEDPAEDGRTGRSHPVLEVQGVHFATGDIIKTLVRRPTLENYKLWLEKENNTPVDKQSVVLLVIDLKNNVTDSDGHSSSGNKEIYMYEIGSQKVSKLSGELSAQFVEVAESNSENDDLDEISDSQRGSFTVKEASEVSPGQRKSRRDATESHRRHPSNLKSSR